MAIASVNFILLLDLTRSSCEKFYYRPIAHDVTAPVTMHLEDKLAIYAMHNITFVNKANFVKLYNTFVLKRLIFALYVVVVPE